MLPLVPIHRDERFFVFWDRIMITDNEKEVIKDERKA